MWHFDLFFIHTLTPETQMFAAHILMLGAWLSFPLFFASARTTDAAPMQTRLLNGFAQEIRGEKIGYRSFHPFARTALLTRCLDGKQVIEWKTAEIPAGAKDAFVTFAWLAAYSCGSSSADATFHVAIGGTEWFNFTTVMGHPVPRWTVKGRHGAELSFDSRMEDSVHDLYGFMFLKIPVHDFPQGKPLTITVVGDSANRRDWYMAFAYPLRDSVSVQAQPALLHTASGPKQQIDVLVEYSQRSGSIDIAVPGQKALQAKLDLGFNSVPFTVNAVEEPREIELSIAISGQSVKKERARIEPVIYKEFWLLPHSHNDIGYSDLQADVMKKQLKNLRDAMQLCGKTASFPKEARFKWNTEILWAVDSFLSSSTKDEREKFIALVKEGSIGLNGLYANELTGLCRPEELLRLTDYARKLERAYDLQIMDAMITDIPGYIWGIVPALAQGGIKYFSSGPNYVPTMPDLGDRVGHFDRAWGDKPFYWVSPSGQEKLLFWVAGKGYSWFHDWIAGKAGPSTGPHLFDYIRELDREKYPYDMIQLRYTIVADNGPTDPDLPDFVRSWNERYESPKLVIATASQMFKEFERRWSKSIPSYAGDITPYWEDGALSSLRELGAVRRASERLVQAEALAAIDGAKEPDRKSFDEAWKNVLLFDEHTWGAHNSISEPESPFAVSQWQVKQRFALDAADQSERLISSLLSSVTGGNAVDIINTSSWPRTDLVVLDSRQRRAGDSVVDAFGTPVPSQRLSNGGLAFVAKDIPPLGARRYFVKAGVASGSGAARATEIGLENGLMSVALDPQTGAFRSLRTSSGMELVDTSAPHGLNQYYYVPGRDPNMAEVNRVKEIVVEDRGPLVATVRIMSEAPGCKSLVQAVTLVDGLGKVEITNIVDKSMVKDKESVHFAFPLNVPGDAYHCDGGWGVVRPMTDQLPGSCMDFLSAGRWVDIANAGQGATWTTVESPLIEIGRMINETPGPNGYRVWRDSVGSGNVFYSYAMNNYWHTNYKAYQEGPVVLSYALFPHSAFDAAEAYRRGIEQSQPLLVRQAADRDPLPASLFTMSSKDVVATSIMPSRDGKAVMVRLYNASLKPVSFTISWGSLMPKKIFVSSPDESQGAPAETSFSLPSFGILTLRCER